MIESVELRTYEILPSCAAIARGQGIPKGVELKENIKSLIDESLGLFISNAHPECIVKEISIKEFDDVFLGNRDNEPEAPLGVIYPQADFLFLFALTMGSAVSGMIGELFRKNDFALGSILDTTASIAADNSVELIEKYITDVLCEKKMIGNNDMVLSYSPGYCGWNISAQKKLFAILHPERIGISLNDSCLMTPIKSVSGVMIAGNKNIHSFESGFGFCFNCKAQSCIERKEKILNH